MKQLVLVAMLAAIASSALTLLGVSLMTKEPAPTHAGVVSAPAADLGGVERELAALRRELTEVMRSGSIQPPAVRPLPAAPPAAPGTAVGAGTSAPTEEGPPPLSVPVPTRHLRLAGVIDTDPASERYGSVRSDLADRWMLRGEREVLDWFGPPDYVYVQDNGSEEWRYNLPEEADPEGKSSITVGIHGGRVVGFH